MLGWKPTSAQATKSSMNIHAESSSTDPGKSRSTKPQLMLSRFNFKQKTFEEERHARKSRNNLQTSHLTNCSSIGPKRSQLITK